MLDSITDNVKNKTKCRQEMLNSHLYIRIEAHPGQALLKCVQDDELREVEVLLCCISKYPLQKKKSENRI